MITKYKLFTGEEIAKMFENKRINVLGIASFNPQSFKGRNYAVWYTEEKERIVEDVF